MGVSSVVPAFTAPLHFVAVTNESESTPGVERVIGGLVFDGGHIPSGRTAYFRWVGTVTDPDSTSIGYVRLYDLGPEGGPEVAPVKRAELTVDASTADEGKVLRKQIALVPSASPGGAPDIFNTPRVYQVRLELTVSAGSETMNVFQAGVSVE
jgi:hypothetical protein